MVGATEQHPGFKPCFRLSEVKEGPLRQQRSLWHLGVDTELLVTILRLLSSFCGVAAHSAGGPCHQSVRALKDLLRACSRTWTDPGLVSGDNRMG